jgi:hypothetical protein
MYILGPAAESPLTDLEKASFAEGIAENTFSIWANGDRAERMAAQRGSVAYLAAQLGRTISRRALDAGINTSFVDKY